MTVRSAAWTASRERRQERREKQRQEQRSARGPCIVDVPDDELDRLGDLVHLMKRSYQRPWPPAPPLHVIARERARNEEAHHTSVTPQQDDWAHHDLAKLAGGRQRPDVSGAASGSGAAA